MTRDKRPDDILRETAPLPNEPLGTTHVEEGTVKWWRDDKGYGVIAVPSITPWDVWCHFAAIEGSGFRSLTEGEPVTVEFYRFDQESFKYLARAVRTHRTP